MGVRIWLFLLLGLPVAASAGDSAPESYGVGLLCPRTDSQVMFYTQNNQQDASGTIAYQQGGGFTLTSDSVKNLEEAGAHLIRNFCGSDMPGIRIDAKRDGWLQAGELWLPPNQEWDYGDWQDYLRKTAVWKPIGPAVLYQGNPEGPYKDKPYPPDKIVSDKSEIYPVKFTDDYALVLIDTNDAYAKTCAGNPTPPNGKLAWVHIGISGDGSLPAFVPAHASGC